MVILGQMNQLKVIEVSSEEWILDGEDYGQIHIPKRATLNMRHPVASPQAGDVMEVFVFKNAKDQIDAVNKKPKVAENEFGKLEVVSVTNIGAFLDWGLPKDLLLPFAEQLRPVEVGDKIFVRVYKNKADGRMVASSKIHKSLNIVKANYHQGQEVDLVCVNKTDLGFKVIINHQHWGVLHNQDIFRKINDGEKIKGFIKNVKPEMKIDVMLTAPGNQDFGKLGDRIIKKLNVSNGFLAVSDKSSPELISELFSVSKKQFKNAIGQLYKKRIITITKQGIELNQQKHQGE